MFRLTLIAAMLCAAQLHAANVRYELLNDPAKQEGKEVAGHITVLTSGSGLPVRGFVSIDNILDWRVECDGKVISMATANRETKGVSMLNQGYGNNLIANKDGLFLQGYGEYPNGSWIEFENIVGGTPPYTESVAFKINMRSIRNEHKVSGRKVTVHEDMIEKSFHFGKSPNWTSAFHTITPAPKMPLAYSNYIKIAGNPTIVEKVEPEPVRPIDPPVTPVKPVVPEVDDSEFYKVYQRISELEREIVNLRHRIQKLEQ